MVAPSEYVLEPIRNGAEFTLYRARQHGEPSPILVVAPTSQQPSPQSLRRLEHEYSLAPELEPSWAAKPLALTRHEGRAVLVLTDPGGEPLDLVLERDRQQPLDLARLLRLAINAATVLGCAHQRGLIHKDVKPENVLVDDAGHVWLTGFGIASRLPRERQAPAPPEIVAGTLPYMSPEQTGRMNRSIDIRSDLYSLGVTLYEMLTGALPFAAADPLEWIHCHIARQPVAPADLRAVPEPLSAITLKLLAKNAEERYQTAAGLEADLRRCLTEWRSHGRIDSFPLAKDDWSDRLLIPEKLYGREREVDALVAAFERVVTHGTAELVLVSGYSGVGKSSVVHELHKVLVPRHGLFAAGKFDQYKRDVPYATLAQAFQVLVRQILVKSEPEVDRWRNALLDALRPNGQLMVNLIPELEFIIGKQPPVADVAPQEARGRFQLVFRRFLGAFATEEHPLALFLDDLQWLDTATLDLLDRLVTDPDVRYVLLIGAYRDNEVSPSHPLMRTLAAVRDAGARAREIVLAPLGLDDVERLIADALRCGPTPAGSLALLIQEKTGGNPFFAIQLLTSLVDEGLLRFDRNLAAWSWDLDRIRGKGYSGNVVDLMLGKLRRLPQHTQTALQQIACLGSVAGIPSLSLVFGKSAEDIHLALLEAVRAGLILRMEDSYAFLHDRIQEAAYRLVPEHERRAAVHLRIGRMLVANKPSDKLDEAIFEIVNQLNRAVSLVIAPEEREQLAEFNLQAGKRAQASSAYVSALNYLAAGAGLLTSESWQRRRELCFNLELARAQCELASGAIVEAEERLRGLSARAVTTGERVAVACLLVDLYQGIDRSDEAVAVGLAALQHLGFNLPERPTEAEARRAYDGVWTRLGNRAIEDLIDLPLMSDPGSLAALDLLIRVAVAGHFFDSYHLFEVAVCTAVSLGFERGHGDASCIAYVQLGTLAGPHFGQYEAGYRFGRLGCALVERPGRERLQARTFETFGFLVPWTQHVRKAREFLFRGFDLANQTGEISYAGYACGQLNTNYLLAGDPLIETQEQAEHGLAFARKVRFGAIEGWILGQLGLIRSLRGLTTRFGCFDDALFRESDLERDLAGNSALALPECWYYIRKLQARFVAGDYDDALQAASRVQRMIRNSVSLLEAVEYHFYDALCHAAVLESASIEDRAHHHTKLTEHLEKLDTWALHCPENFATRAALVAAEVARIEGRELDAEQLYERAISSARGAEMVHNEALAHELSGRFYLARGIETAGYAYLRNARTCYERWGAHGKVRQLDERYPQLREERPFPSSATIRAPQLDVETVVEAGQALSSEMILPTLIEKLMRIAVEHAGAARGLLILIHDGEPQIEAQATVASGRVEVAVRQAAVTPFDLPQSALHYVIRTRECILLDDASGDSLYSNDEYVRQKASKSVLCLPIVKQGQLVGVLYLENNLAPCVFTPERFTVLQLLASQAAISLENATLYSDLQLQAGLLQNLPVSAWTLNPDGTADFVNQVWLEYSGQTLDFVRSHPEAWMAAVHPEDREAASRDFWAGIHSGQGFATETRSLRVQDGTYRWHLQQAVVLHDAEGKVLKFVGTTTDIDDQKRAEEKIRQSEKEARQLLDLSPLHIAELRPDGARLYTNRASLDYFGITLEEWQNVDLQQLLHPQDAATARDLPGKLQSGSPFEYEVRFRRNDGQYRWFHYRLSPVSDDQGRVTRWYAAGTDIDDRKLAEERLQEENVALREEVDKASMFEEIVGISAPLKKVLSRISRVAPTGSSVLITGETGTGKELVARAIHRRSRRSSHPFVSVNCAAIPRDLIASELFGHEKGAFTGATQRRLGRFELAEKGTIFLDEVGELPAETQIALLRVLQEREFERIGGTGSIETDVRVVAATNRDLEASIAAGTFRSDLYYRLNVFPIEMPTLRERNEDIPLLVEYFLARYARKAGKSFQMVNKQSLELLQSYPWPGNIRELQNVIERSVIVSDGKIFSVDESWLLRQPRTHEPVNPLELSQKLAAQEKEIIEAALRECGGRVSGSTGAAARLSMPGSTLESKIKSLKIDKNRFKGSTRA